VSADRMPVVNDNESSVNRCHDVIFFAMSRFDLITAEYTAFLPKVLPSKKSNMFNFYQIHTRKRY